ncbi:Autophagy-related protein 25 [Cyberlindnera fabianii]|uniref:Autophagy-related protein 25 n=1 Tax=Cyberlindnera fabianii TaxID=36022 RepID=A0A1V2L8K6_CYBFA|nr:Autophagy-related protein 25 [Cyberlindnera fabianii]
MSDTESIKKASELVNSVLFARGYFPSPTDQDASGVQDKLLFSTIDASELETPEQIYGNDKLVLNTIYSLLQELDHAKTEKQYLSDQLADKAEIIKHYESSNRELNAQLSHHRRDTIHHGNETTLLKQTIKSLKAEKVVQDRHLQQERNVSQSLRTMHDVEMKKKSIQIEKLQNKLLSRRRKFQSIIERNNHSYTADTTTIEEDTRKLALDDELERMMVNLSDLITNLTHQNNSGVQLLNYMHTYVSLLTEHLVRKNMEGTEGTLPPSPKFFYDSYQAQQGAKGDITERISHIVEMDKLKPGVMETMERLYDVVTSEGMSSANGASRTSGIFEAKVEQMTREINGLRKNLETAMETNEKWRQKFQQLGKK